MNNLKVYTYNIQSAISNTFRKSRIFSISNAPCIKPSTQKKKAKIN